MATESSSQRQVSMLLRNNIFGTSPRNLLILGCLFGYFSPPSFSKNGPVFMGLSAISNDLDMVGVASSNLVATTNKPLILKGFRHPLVSPFIFSAHFRHVFGTYGLLNKLNKTFIGSMRSNLLRIISRYAQG